MSLFSKATRLKAKARIALIGVTGSGKTLSALYFAYGITGDWNKIALIDTEHARARFYANRSDLGTGEFHYAELDSPYSPDRYKMYVAEAASIVGADGVVIVDSFSHAWNNEGGVLDIKERIVATNSKINDFSAWNQAGKVQNNLVNSVLSVDCHTIITMRSKMDYVLVEKEVNGRKTQSPQKVGLAPVQREGLEYEFDLVMTIDRDHTATIEKDTTIFNDFYGVITPDMGVRLREWLELGVEPPQKHKCEICGEQIKAIPTKTVDELVTGAQATIGKKACSKCLVEWNRTNKAKKLVHEQESMQEAQ